MNDRDKEEARRIASVLQELHQGSGLLPGVAGSDERWCLACQIVDSLRRIRFAHFLRDKNHSSACAVPYSGCFDPLKAAVLANRRGDLDEAWWLVFLATHFGKHAVDKWQLVEAVYGALNEREEGWTWAEAFNDQRGFLAWLRTESMRLKQFRFSNHRKYESLDPTKKVHVGNVVKSYFEWVGRSGKHSDLLVSAHRAVGQHPGEAFNHLYMSMSQVRRFGRLGRFDFLTMIGKLGIAPIEPNSAYLWHNATGPLKGARLLFDGNKLGASSPDKLDQLFLDMDKDLKVGMQVLEDATCNWQKSPRKYLRFRG